MKSYAGIGSRRVPKSEYWKFAEVAEILEDLGYSLNSGGAGGSDQFFEDSTTVGTIFLPWNGFNGKSISMSKGNMSYEVPEVNLDLVRQFHPAFDRLSQAAQKLMSRNSYQVLGQGLKNPVDMVICWTPSGKDEGGTAQACRIARSRNIPVYNLNSDKERRLLLDRLKMEEHFKE